METNLPQQGAEDEIDLREVSNVLLRNRWLILGSFCIGVAAAIAVTLLITPVYESATSIRIDTRQSNIPALDILRTLSTGSEVDTEMEVLRSRSLAEDVVDSLALQLILREPRRTARKEVLDFASVHREAPATRYTFERQDDGRFVLRDPTPEMPRASYAPGERIELNGAVIVLAPGAVLHRAIELDVVPFATAVRGLRSATTVSRPNREASVVIARFQSTDTVLVQQIPNTLARRFIARRGDFKKTETRSTVDFLSQQLDTLQVQLTAAEDSLRNFREREQVVSLGEEATTRVRELAALKAQRDQIEAERASLSALLADVRAAAAEVSAGEASPYRRLLAFPTLLRNQAASELLRTLNALENERATLLQRRTPRDPDVQVLAARIGELEDQLRGIAVTYLQGLTGQSVSLDATLAQSKSVLAEIPAKEVQFARLVRQTKVLEEIYTLLQTRLKEAEIAQAVVDGSVRVVDTAILPALPIKPRKAFNLVLGAVLGLLLGVAAAFTREFMDTTVHTREDVQRFTQAPVLGLIPRIREAAGRNGRGRSSAPEAGGFEARLVTGHDPRNPVSEAYRSLRTNITFARPERPAKTIVFTSPTPGDGKSTSSANLAITLVQQGLNVLLVDADMRRGILHGVFNAVREPGLSNILLGMTALADAVQEIDLGESGKLAFLGTGTLPPNPAELLGSERMRSLLERVEDSYDAIILDAPPLNLVTDAALLGTNADGVIIIARASKTEKAALMYAMEQLRNVRAPVLGAVLNDIDFERDAKYYGRNGSYGYYQYYYGREKEA